MAKQTDPRNDTIGFAPMEKLPTPSDGKTERTVVEAGTYEVDIAWAKSYVSKFGDQGLALDLKITHGRHHGEVVRVICFMVHRTPFAQQNGRKLLTQLCRALKLTRLDNAAQVIGRHVCVEFTRKDHEKYGPTNFAQQFIESPHAPTVETKVSEAEEEDELPF